MKLRAALLAACAVTAVTGCGSGIAVTSVDPDHIAYASGYLSGQKTEESGDDLTQWCLEQGVQWSEAVDNKSEDVARVFLRGCEDGANGVEPEAWPSGQQRPALTP